jgi:Fic family protein
VLSIVRWNWRQPDWPNFVYDATRLRGREDQFLKGAGILVGVMAHLDADDRQKLSIELMAQEAVDSSAIEGEILDRASVQSSVAKHLGFKADHRRANAAEAGLQNSWRISSAAIASRSAMPCCSIGTPYS